MKRRRFLELLAGSAGIGFLRPRTLAGAESNLARRVRPGDSGWPAADAWKALGQQLRGSLTRVDSPFAAGPVAPAILKQLENPYFVGDQAWATQSSGWAGAWSSKPSAWAVAARTAEDVAAAVSFAREAPGPAGGEGRRAQLPGHLERVRLAAGVDAADGSDRPARRVHPAGLCRKGRPGSRRERRCRGSLELHTYDAVTTHGGRYVQGGGCATVGVAGLIQSGGFGSFSKRYGTAAACLLEADVVTADGTLRMVNAWVPACKSLRALKGPGGGSFGVATLVTPPAYAFSEVLLRGGSIF